LEFCARIRIKVGFFIVPTLDVRRYSQCAGVVIPARKPVSSVMNGELKYIHESWIPAIPAGMTDFEKLVHNYDRSNVITMPLFIALKELAMKITTEMI
jgi:hypothetical protein